MARLLFRILWKPDLHLFPSIPLDSPCTFCLSYTFQVNDIFYQHVLYKTYNYISPSKTEKWKLSVDVIRENCIELTERISRKRSILSWRFCTSLCLFQIFILKKRSNTYWTSHFWILWCVFFCFFKHYLIFILIATQGRGIIAWVSGKSRNLFIKSVVCINLVEKANVMDDQTMSHRILSSSKNESRMSQKSTRDI